MSVRTCDENESIVAVLLLLVILFVFSDTGICLYGHWIFWSDFMSALVL